MEVKETMNQPKIRIFLAGLMAMCAMLVLAYYVAGQQGDFDARAPFGDTGIQEPRSLESIQNLDTLVPTSCRHGVGYVPNYSQSLAWTPTLNAGWYINFSAQNWGLRVNSATFAPVVRINQDFGPSGERLPTYTFNPPLSYFYLDQDNKLQPGLGKLIVDNPGHFWIVGNEVDVNNAAQDNIYPEVYARAYHEAYHTIKRIDPSAKVAVAGLSMMTPGRLQYLSIVWDTYRAVYGVDMPVDIWNMHLYILEERNPNNQNEYGDGKIALGTDPALAKLTSNGNANLCPNPNAPDTPENDPRHDVHCRAEHSSVRIFREQVYAMRQWMKERGQQNKPLIISEYGLLYPYLDGQPNGSCEFLQDENQRCFNPVRVTTYLNDTVSFLENTKDPTLGYPADENRLVQQWLWYSIVTHPEWSGGSSNLLVDNFANYAPGDPAALSMMGQAFKQRASAQLGTSNLVGGIAYDAAGSIESPANTTSVTLTASFRNSGTRSIIEPAVVTFYSDQALTKVIGSVTYDPIKSGAITGCTWDGRNSEQVSIRWNDLPVGTYNYWAKIDSNSVIVESSEADNITTKGTVTIYPYALKIPVVQR